MSLRDLAYVPRREFKVLGGQVDDNSSDRNCNNICKQMDGVTREGFPDTERARGVLRIIKRAPSGTYQSIKMVSP